MNQNIGKVIQRGLALSLFLVFNPLLAVSDMQMRNLENRVSALEQRRGANGMINPPANPVVKDGIDLWVQGEGLLMHPTEDNLSYAVQGNALQHQSVLDMKYPWCWGFRVGIGYNFPRDGWDLLANWTELKSRDANGSHSGDTIGQTYSAFNGVSQDTNFAKGEAYFRFDSLDVDLGRAFFVSKWLTLRPSLGVRGIWLSRTLKAIYKDQSSGGYTLEVAMDNQFHGAGLKAGLDTQWGLGSGFSIFGTGCGALVYGNHKLAATQVPSGSLPPSSLFFSNISRDWVMLRSMLGLGIGLRWDQLLDADRYRIHLQLGWDEILFSGFGQDMKFITPSSRPSPSTFISNQGNFAMSGLSFQARFDF